MIYYRIEWGEWGEDDAWNTIYVPCNTFQLNFPEEKSVDELKQIVYQQILDDKSEYRTAKDFPIKDLILGEILKSNSPIEKVKLPWH